jgi:hypothetical protein
MNKYNILTLFTTAFSSIHCALSHGLSVNDGEEMVLNRFADGNTPHFKVTTNWITAKTIESSVFAKGREYDLPSGREWQVL